MLSNNWSRLAVLGFLGSMFACSGNGAPHKTSATTTGSGSGGSGGQGTSSSAGGAGPSDVYPAVHPKPPQLFDYGGPVLAKPNLVPVFFANDDAAIDTQFADFIAKLGGTTYWAVTTSEYGIGPATSSPPIQAPDMPSGTIDDKAIQAFLADRINSNDPLYPKVDANTVFVLPYPKSATITMQGATGCKLFGAYHNSFTVDANHGGLAVPYIVVPRCIIDMSEIDTLTSATSHEIVEASTDPFPETNPAYGRVDLPDYAWKLNLGGEACDMCAPAKSAFETTPGFPFMVQRCWSNKAAAALHDPCAEPAPGVPYFNAVPVLPNDVTVNLFGYMVTLHSVNIAVGDTKDVEVDLFSDAPTGGPWQVSVENVGPVIGGDGTASDLDLSLDQDHGQNGEKLTLHVHVLKSGQYGLEMFRLRSTLGTRDSIWVGTVTN